MSFFQLSPLIGAIIFCLGAIISALVVYFILRRLLVPYLSDDTQTLSSSILVRMGTLYALILALVFAQEFADYIEVKDTINNEAAAISTVYHGLEKFNSQTTEEIRRTVAKYVQTVIREEWVMLSQKKLSDNAWEHYRNVKVGLLHLDPKDLFQKDLRSQMIRDCNIIAKSRIARLAAATHELPTFFIVICIVGFFFVMVPYFAFSPKFANIFLLVVHAAFNGLIIYFVLIIANPFSLSVSIEPNALETFMNKYIANVLTGLKGS